MLPVVGTRIGQRYVPDWPGAGRVNPQQGSDQRGIERWVAWRLLAGNGWEIARSALVFPDIAACQAAVHALAAAAGHADWVTMRGLLPGSWSWELRVDGTPAAVASRLYKLQRECESALRTFLTVLPMANVSLTNTGERMASSG